MARITPFIPQDPLFSQQWHLLNTGNTPASVAGHDINVVYVWPDYSGKGVLIGIQDDGMDDSHPDLVANYRPELAWDTTLDVPGASARLSDDAHGVAVAGLAAAASNGIGGVGVAWGSEFTMYRLDFAIATTFEGVLNAYRSAAEKQVEAGVAVSNNSWTPGALPSSEIQQGFHDVTRMMAEQGRGGLGTAVVFAGGNDRMEGMNANYDPTDNSPWGITVAASLQDGNITSYSTPGASLLITSTGSGVGKYPPASMVTSDRQGIDGYNKTPGTAGDYVYAFNGTSSAAPVATGVIALMLEANAGLGYRDVQEILAYSATRAGFVGSKYDHAYNGAKDWNGGAMLASHDFGYGHINAHAAVRLAESWMKQGTVSNLVIEQGHVLEPVATVGAGNEGVAKASFAPGYRVEHMMVTVDIEADHLPGLTLQLISPDGMVSTLMDRLPVDDSEPDDADDANEPDTLNTSFHSVLHWGAELAGEWQLKLVSAADTGTVHLKDWSITAYTAGEVSAGTQVFTDEFSQFARWQPERGIIDAGDGITLNAASVTQDVRFDLASGISHLGDANLSLNGAADFRNLITGDGNDIIIGNAAGNILMAGRGNNHIDGGAGVDVLRLIGEHARYSVERHDDLITVQSHELAGGGTDAVYNVELLHFADQVVLARTPQNLGSDLFDEAAYLAQNPDVQLAVLAGSLQSGREHYQQWGAAEGRSPNSLFDEQWYLAQHADVAQAVVHAGLRSGFEHYLEWGWKEGRDPSAWMDASAYLAGNPDVGAAQLNPLQHYLIHGVHEGRQITALEPDMWV